MDKDTHVYCVNCVYGKLLINSIVSNKDLPERCNNCNPHYPEDSMKHSDRPNYIPKNNYK